MKILYRYIDASGNVIEEHAGALGNWSMIPGLAVSVQVVERATEGSQEKSEGSA